MLVRSGIACDIARDEPSPWEAVLIHVDHGRVADRLVDVVRGWIGEIGEQEAGAAAGGELAPADVGSQVAGVAAAAAVRRRVDRADADPARGRTGSTGERDGLPGVLPDVGDAADPAKHAIGRLRGIA